jgi:hypothetical protein
MMTDTDKDCTKQCACKEPINVGPSTYELLKRIEQLENRVKKLEQKERAGAPS